VLPLTSSRKDRIVDREVMKLYARQAARHAAREAVGPKAGTLERRPHSRPVGRD